MKQIFFFSLLILLFTNCTSQKNSEDFVKATTGRYLFNADEVLEIYFKDNKMHAKWRGNDNLALVKLNDSAFYMRELNEKLLFITQPNLHIKLAPKTEHKGIRYQFRKLKDNEKTPSEYFKEKEFDKALQAFLEIQKNNPKSPLIREKKIRRIGNKFLKEKDFDTALEIFTINMHLYPKRSTIFNSLGDVYLLKKDTINAIVNFNKALAINPENRKAKRILKKISEK